MDCREARALEERHLDAEVDAMDEEAIERHLASCAGCRERFTRDRLFQTSLRRVLDTQTQAEAPPELEARIRTELSLAARTTQAWPVRRLSAAAAIAAAALAAWPLRTSEAGRLVEDLVDRHASNLPPEIRVSSGDDAELRRFFGRNLARPVALPELAVARSPVRLVGGRLAFAHDTDIPYVMYEHRGAKLSLFVSTGVQAPQSSDGFERRSIGDRLVWVGARRGYNVVLWEGHGSLYALVSDVDASELVTLAGDVR